LSSVTLPFVRMFKGIESVVLDCPAVTGKGRWAGGIIGQEIWQQRDRHPHGILWRVSTGMLQGVREVGNETRIACWFTRQVGISLRVDKDG
jgi:hypothetical protein